MREIEFRAKRIDNGEWVYGSLVVETYPDFCCYYMRTKDEEDWTSRYMNVPVDKETVGQYTGLKDKNGKKIFEGDILECEGGVYFSETYRGLVEFEKGVFVAKGSTVDFQPEMFNDCKIIGNVCDDPDLIE